MARWLRVVKAVPGAVMLGVGTLLQPKARPDDHWSVSPDAAVVEDGDVEGSGAPPRPS
jgi:hypothetical protein